MTGFIRLITVAGVTAATMVTLAAMPAGEPARRALDAAGERLGWIQEPQVPSGSLLASTWMGSRFALSGHVEVAGDGEAGDRSVIEFARMLEREIERREGRYGILPFGDTFSGAASQGGNGGGVQAGDSRQGGLGAAGSLWAILSLGALMLMTRRWQ
ncbi:MAG: hypothetical protein M9951_03980 [Burkholderiaceae bacterium]|nr:hypothetical protein [Burkholderiaceae bacterium]MEB2320824.1 hypothetical protein [Pseudomonadota bacterium]